MIRHPAAAAAASLLFLVGSATPALAGGRGPTRTTASCTASATEVQAVGLPTGEVVNFFVTDSTGTHGWVLGFTPDGTWSVAVPAPSGPTTYQFTSRTWGPNGAKYTVFASCAA